MGRTGNDDCLVICLFDGVPDGRRGVRQLELSHPELAGRVALMLDVGGQICLVDAKGDEPDPVEGVIARLSSVIAGGVLPQGEQFHIPGCDLVADDLIRLAVELECGNAVAVLVCSTGEADRATVELTHLGGKLEQHALRG